MVPADTGVAPVTLIRDAYRAEILGDLAAAGEEVLHAFPQLGAGVLRQRLNARVVSAADPKVLAEAGLC